MEAYTDPVNNVKVIEDIDEQIRTTLLQKQRIGFEKKLEIMRNIKTNKGKNAAIFYLKTDIFGSKSVASDPTTIIDTETKTEISTASEIRKVSLQYCKTLLTNRNPKHQYEEDIRLKHLVHSVRMNEVIENDINFLSEEMLENTY